MGLHASLEEGDWKAVEGELKELQRGSHQLLLGATDWKYPT